jgi:hypothetical protein
MKSTLVVGGEASFVTSKLAPALAQHGLRVDANWPWDKEKGAFPDATEVVFVLTDMAGHRLNDAAQVIAQQRSLPIVYGVRKWALNVARLEKMGFPALNREQETMTYSHDSAYSRLGEKGRQDYTKVMHALLESPGLTNSALMEATGFPKGTIAVLANMARNTMGVTTSAGNLPVTLERDRYEYWCKKYEVAPVEGTQIAKVGSVAPKVVTPEPAPAPRQAFTPVALPKPKPTDEMQDFRDIVNLLRAEMEKRNITRLVVTPEGVDATRVVTVNESLGF